VKVKYVGVHTEVSLPEYRLVFGNGEVVDLPADVGEALIATGEWQTVRVKSKKKPSAGEEEK
jgi:hypothetical protein